MVSAPPQQGLDTAALPGSSASASAPRFAARATAPALTAGFEDASPQCDDWTADGGVGIRSIPSRSGDYACKICSTGETPVVALTHATGPLDPGRYVLQAWVRARAPSVSSASAVLSAASASGVASREGALTPVGNEYEMVEVALDIPSPVASLDLRIQAPAAKGECVLIDDVALLQR